MGPIRSAQPTSGGKKRSAIRDFGCSLLRLTRVLAVFYLLICLGARYLSTWMLFAPPSLTYGEKLRGLVVLTGAEGQKFAAVHLPNPTAKQIILLFHGNGDDLGATMARVEALNVRGFAVLEQFN